MKKLLYIFILSLLPLLSIGQTITGQVLLTESQRVYLRDFRYNTLSGNYISTNFAGNGFFGDAATVQTGAEIFLNEEESTGYVDQWANASTAIPVASGSTQVAPMDNYTPSGYGSWGGERIHFAGLLSYIWQDDNTVVTFSGQTKARSAHAHDLATAVFNVLYEQSQYADIDFSNRSKYPIDFGIGAPLMYYVAKMEKYLHTFSMIVPIIDGDTFFETNVAAVETWLTNAAEWAWLKSRFNTNTALGVENPADFNSSTPATGWNQQSSAYPYVFYNSSGVGQWTSNLAPRTVASNIPLDYVNMILSYGLIFNNASYRDYAFEMYKFAMKMCVFPDGTWQEHDRSEIGEESLGINYVAKSVGHLAFLAYKHAVAVENGITGVTNKGLYFDYTTSEGSDELYTSFATTSTSGGNKNLKLVCENFAKHFLTSANGGFSDVRYAEGGGNMNANERPYVTPIALANTYFNDGNLKLAYKQDEFVGYNGARYYQDGGSPVYRGDGPYTTNSLAAMWAKIALIGGFSALADMETRVFSVTSPPPTNPDNSILKKYKGYIIYYKGVPIRN